MIKTLKVRVKDNHSTALNRMAISVNQVWNYCNDLSYRNIKERHKFLSGYDFNPYLNGTSKLLGLLQSTVRLVSYEYAAKRNKYKKCKLRWRSSYGRKRSLGWIPIDGQNIKFKNDKIIINGVSFGIFNAKYLHGYELRQGSFNQDSRGRWYFNVFVKIKPEISKATTSVGIDLGCKESATSSCGAKLHGREYRALELKLGAAQRARKLNRTRAIHAKIKNKRTDSIHKFTTKLVRENAAIFVGNVNSMALIKTKMAKSVLDAGWGIIKQQLTYKCDYAGVVFEVVNEAYTTVTCSACKNRTGPTGLEGLRIRGWTCVQCGASHDRDINASLNIRALGHERLAGGITLRREDVK